nr:unnamed protein product [Callosobruchus analis]
MQIAGATSFMEESHTDDEEDVRLNLECSKSDDEDDLGESDHHEASDNENNTETDLIGDQHNKSEVEISTSQEKLPGDSEKNNTNDKVELQSSDNEINDKLDKELTKNADNNDIADKQQVDSEPNNSDHAIDGNEAKTATEGEDAAMETDDHQNKGQNEKTQEEEETLHKDDKAEAEPTGKQLLVVNNFKYSFQKCLKSGERRWICLNKKCKSFILSLGEMENVTVTKHITEHCHEANLEKLNRQIVSSSCKREATEDLSEKPAKIIRRVLQDNLPSTITTCDVAYVRRNIEKGKPLLLSQNYKFRKYRELKTTGEMCWCCTVKNCVARIYTIGSEYVFSRKAGDHRHEPQSDQLINRQRISNQVKRKAEVDIAERPRKLIHMEISTKKNTLETLTTKDIQCIRKNIQRDQNGEEVDKSDEKLLKDVENNADEGKNSGIQDKDEIQKDANKGTDEGCNGVEQDESLKTDCPDSKEQVDEPNKPDHHETKADKTETSPEGEGDTVSKDGSQNKENGEKSRNDEESPQKDTEKEAGSKDEPENNDDGADKYSLLKETLSKPNEETKEQENNEEDMDEDFDPSDFDPSLLCPEVAMEVEEAPVISPANDAQNDEGAKSPILFDAVFSTYVDEMTGTETCFDLTPEEDKLRQDTYGQKNPVQFTKIHCTACNVHLGSALDGQGNRFVHPLLKVLICKNCYFFYSSGEFERDEDGSELYCRWCGQGGQVMCCSKCEMVFCKKCIRINFDRKKIADIRDSDDWFRAATLENYAAFTNTDHALCCQSLKKKATDSPAEQPKRKRRRAAPFRPTLQPSGMASTQTQRPATTPSPGYIKILPGGVVVPGNTPRPVRLMTPRPQPPAMRAQTPNQSQIKHEWFEKTVRAAARVNSNLSYTLTNLNRAQAAATSVEALAVIHNKLQEILSTSINSLIQIRKNLRAEFIQGIKNARFPTKPQAATTNTTPTTRTSKNSDQDDDVIIISPAKCITIPDDPPEIEKPTEVEIDAKKKGLDTTKVIKVDITKILAGEDPAVESNSSKGEKRKEADKKVAESTSHKSQEKKENTVAKGQAAEEKTSGGKKKMDSEEKNCKEKLVKKQSPKKRHREKKKYLTKKKVT